jgi:hypothetical protein
VTRSVPSVLLIVVTLMAGLPSLASGGTLSRKEAGIEYQKMIRERYLQGKPLPRFEEMIDLLSEEARKDLILESLKSGMLPPLPLPERWDYVQDPTTALRQADYDFEPLPPIAVKALERVFPLATDPGERLRLGALLYRYGREMGRQYLIQEVRDHRNEEAAIILAWNQDDTAWPDLQTFFVNNPRPSDELLYGLGRWAPKTSLVLSAGYLRAERGALQDYERAFALGKHKVERTVLERLQQRYDKGGREHSGKTITASTLLWLQPNHQAALTYLTERAATWRSLSEIEQSLLFNTIQSVSVPQLSILRQQVATTLVEQYLAQSDPRGIDQSLSGASRNAVLELVANGGKKGQDLGLATLYKMVGKKESPTEARTLQPASLSSIYAVAEALIDSGVPDIERTINTLLAKEAEALESLLLFNREFTATLRAIRKLRELPTRYTPVFSREFVHTPNWVQPPGSVPDLR